ncbi:MAG TPA: alpha/beta hydrolase [Caulobacteraceae bacterium]|nr:alpha/beta hydrolase [Caulobacteraceae bacterium]
MPEFRVVDAGTARIRVALEGEGPLALMVHGFPESWYSWRHQIGPIAAAGFTACAIDVRGYGGSQKFSEVADFSMENIVADVRGVADALSPGRPAVLIGHDWGAPIVYNSALIHPDRFTAVSALSVIYTGVPTRSFDDVIKEQFDDKNLFFYQSYFREPGRAEAVFDPNPRDFLRKFYYIASGDVDVSRLAGAFAKDASSALLDGMPDPDPFPAWLSAADLDYFVGEFERSGFFGPLSRYRNHTRDFHYLQAFKDRSLDQPAFFIAGNRDGAFNGFGAMSDPIAVMRTVVPHLEGAHVLDGCGHWTQQERPAEVTALLVPWLKTLKGRVL